MRRPVVVAMSGLSLVVVGASLKASELHRPPRSLGTASVVSPGLRPSSATSGAAATSAASPATATPPARSVVTVNGAAFDTQYGPVQVQITVKSGRITHADAPEYPQSNGRDQEINAFAIPRLDRETVGAQSAQIDTVSGATYTSDGYRASLQSAIDAAHQAGAL